jgi:hypothetical protein
VSGGGGGGGRLMLGSGIEFSLLLDMVRAVSKFDPRFVITERFTNGDQWNVIHKYVFDRIYIYIYIYCKRRLERTYIQPSG